jgi:hypothetical protein
MTRAVIFGLLLLGIASVPLAIAAEKPKEPKPCLEGRLITGECVNEHLAQSTRDLAMSMAQPKFSYSAPARLPNGDYVLGPQTNIRELNSLFRQGYLSGAP